MFAIGQEKVALVTPGTGFVYAPVERGQHAGTAYVLIGEQVIGKIGLIYGQTVEQEEVPEQSFWRRIFGGERIG